VRSVLPSVQLDGKLFAPSAPLDGGRGVIPPAICRPLMERQSALAGAASVQILHSTCNSCIAYVTTGAWMRARSRSLTHTSSPAATHIVDRLSRSDFLGGNPREIAPPAPLRAGHVHHSAPVAAELRGFLARPSPGIAVLHLSPSRLPTRRVSAVRAAVARSDHPATARSADRGRVAWARHSDHNKERHSESVLMALKRRTFNRSAGLPSGRAPAPPTGPVRARRRCTVQRQRRAQAQSG